jgi:hypothetical protein
LDLYSEEYEQLTAIEKLPEIILNKLSIFLCQLRW